MLDIRWLEDFLAIANSLSFTKAAELRNVSQSGLSRRVQSLEHWAGAPLIDRNAVPLQLTDAGRDLHPVATMIIHNLGQLKSRIADRTNKDSKLIRLTAPHLLSTTFFPEWLPRISQIGGNSEIIVVSQNLLNCFEALDRADVHFIVCLADRDRSMFKNIPASLRADPDMVAKVGEDRLMLVSARKPGGGAIFDLGAGEVPLLQYTPECSLGWTVEDVLAKNPDVRSRTISTNPFADGLRLMALGGVGIAWLPRSLIAHDLEAGTLAAIGDGNLDVSMDVLVIRPSYRLAMHGERIWRSISEGGNINGKAGPPQLHAIG